MKAFEGRSQALDHFLRTAATEWSARETIKTFELQDGEYLSIIRWQGQCYATGTDILRVIIHKVHAFGNKVVLPKKFEEGVFSDLRLLKPGQEAVLEEPKSPFLRFLFDNGCIRTQKKQKVFIFERVPWDKLFFAVLERDDRRETGKPLTMKSTAEPALSFAFEARSTSCEDVLEAIYKHEARWEIKSPRRIASIYTTEAQAGPPSSASAAPLIATVGTSVSRPLVTSARVHSRSRASKPARKRKTSGKAQRFTKKLALAIKKGDSSRKKAMRRIILESDESDETEELVKVEDDQSNDSASGNMTIEDVDSEETDNYSWYNQSQSWCEDSKTESDDYAGTPEPSRQRSMSLADSQPYHDFGIPASPVQILETRALPIIQVQSDSDAQASHESDYAEPGYEVAQSCRSVESEAGDLYEFWPATGEESTTSSYLGEGSGALLYGSPQDHGLDLLSAELDYLSDSLYASDADDAIDRETVLSFVSSSEWHETDVAGTSPFNGKHHLSSPLKPFPGICHSCPPSPVSSSGRSPLRRPADEAVIFLN